MKKLKLTVNNEEITIIEKNVSSIEQLEKQLHLVHAIITQDIDQIIELIADGVSGNINMYFRSTEISLIYIVIAIDNQMMTDIFLTNCTRDNSCHLDKDQYSQIKYLIEERNNIKLINEEEGKNYKTIEDITAYEVLENFSNSPILNGEYEELENIQSYLIPSTLFEIDFGSSTVKKVDYAITDENDYASINEIDEADQDESDAAVITLLKDNEANLTRYNILDRDYFVEKYLKEFADSGIKYDWAYLQTLENNLTIPEYIRDGIIAKLLLEISDSTDINNSNIDESDAAVTTLLKDNKANLTCYNILDRDYFVEKYLKELANIGIKYDWDYLHTLDNNLTIPNDIKKNIKEKLLIEIFSKVNIDENDAAVIMLIADTNADLSKYKNLNEDYFVKKYLEQLAGSRINYDWDYLLTLESNLTLPLSIRSKLIKNLLSEFANIIGEFNQACMLMFKEIFNKIEAGNLTQEEVDFLNFNYINNLSSLTLVQLIDKYLPLDKNEPSNDNEQIIDIINQVILFYSNNSFLNPTFVLNGIEVLTSYNKEEVLRKLNYAIFLQNISIIEEHFDKIMDKLMDNFGSEIVKQFLLIPFKLLPISKELINYLEEKQRDFFETQIAIDESLNINDENNTPLHLVLKQFLDIKNKYKEIYIERKYSDKESNISDEQLNLDHLQNIEQINIKETIKRLIAKDKSALKVKNIEEQYPLDLAYISGDLELFKLLYNSSEDSDKDDIKYLHDAYKNLNQENIEIIKFILQEKPYKIFDRFLENPLKVQQEDLLKVDTKKEDKLTIVEDIFQSYCPEKDSYKKELLKIILDLKYKIHTKSEDKDIPVVTVKYLFNILQMTCKKHNDALKNHESPQFNVELFIDVLDNEKILEHYKTLLTKDNELAFITKYIICQNEIATYYLDSNPPTECPYWNLLTAGAVDIELE